MQTRDFARLVAFFFLRVRVYVVNRGEGWGWALSGFGLMEFEG